MILRKATLSDLDSIMKIEEASFIPQTSEELKLGHIPDSMAEEKSRNPYIYISSFALFPEFRGGGNGRNMRNKSMEYFKQKFSPSALLLLVNDLWDGAKHIYSKSGFEVIRIFSHFFPCDDGSFSNGILMQNLLK